MAFVVVIEVREFLRALMEIVTFRTDEIDLIDEPRLVEMLPEIGTPAGYFGDWSPNGTEDVHQLHLCL